MANGAERAGRLGNANSKILYSDMYNKLFGGVICVAIYNVFQYVQKFGREANTMTA